MAILPDMSNVIPFPVKDLNKELEEKREESIHLLMEQSIEKLFEYFDSIAGAYMINSKEMFALVKEYHKDILEMWAIHVEETWQ